MEKIRLDVLLEEKGLVESRTSGQRLIMAGEVRVNGVVQLKPAIKVERNDLVEVTKPPRFVSRGGEKLVAALEAFGFTDLNNKVCVDVGASTGGFTDCLLQHGAEAVYAIDVGYGEFHWKLRNDPRVVLMERTNARYVTGFERKIDLVVVDASFISLRTLLPVIKTWFHKTGGSIVALIKPQFEAGRVDAAKGDGVIRDPLIHRKVLTEIMGFAMEEDMGIKGLIQSPLTGPKGNIEFLIHLEYPGKDSLSIEDLISRLFPSAE
jgi:23S rRNA (cytidine1920-2'-O)/16S rRNA (cytidine1409-2'-O)-methyltransferase